MTTPKTFSKISSFKSAGDLRAYADELGCALDFEDEILSAPDSPLAGSFEAGGFHFRNRFCIHPMEGWDGTLDGNPSPNTLRRWQRFGQSGASLIWGCEAVAVRHDGRANPNQLAATESTKRGLEQLRTSLLNAHKERYGTLDGLVVGLQLTHSGRFSRPDEGKGLQSQIAYHHPVLDPRFGCDPNQEPVSDLWLEELIGDFVRAARITADLGFDFVDLKACHGYLGHELLSARRRPGPYGGDFESRIQFHRLLIEAVQRDVPEVQIGVRLSVFDFVPYKPDPETTTDKKKGAGVPDMENVQLPYDCGFGTLGNNPIQYDLEEPIRFVRLLKDMGVFMVNLTAGSPYYNPHIQRPALFPPSDGYAPPEDPLCGVSRQIQAAREVKAAVPDMPTVGTAYTYLQEFLPHVAQSEVRNGHVDFVGMGRMVLSYPTLPDDVLNGRPLQSRSICRTFSDCTTAPRNHLPSGCYPLDEFYKRSGEGDRLRSIKRGE